MQRKTWAVLEKVRGIQEQAEREGRELTAAERAEVKGLVDRARDASEVEAEIRALQRNLDGDGYQRSPRRQARAVLPQRPRCRSA
jgi:hypothetical protein